MADDLRTLLDRPAGQLECVPVHGAGGVVCRAQGDCERYMDWLVPGAGRHCTMCAFEEPDGLEVGSPIPSTAIDKSKLRLVALQSNKIIDESIHLYQHQIEPNQTEPISTVQQTIPLRTPSPIRIHGPEQNKCRKTQSVPDTSPSGIDVKCRGFITRITRFNFHSMPYQTGPAVVSTATSGDILKNMEARLNGAQSSLPKDAENQTPRNYRPS